MGGVRLYTPEEVAEQLKIGRRTVADMLRRGELRGRKIAGKWRVLEEDLEAFVRGVDDEPLSPEDLQAVHRGLEDVKAGRVKTLEQYEAERGLGPAL
ncbi:helix-turn-helix domain-containing protein [Limnochorda pilosa]|uniref:Molybdenum-pterin binding protein n=1 Tax=Limnochorda pilosa TaxID=1555112 RepID=A0A0K2SNP2_LIMPI|nr:helix-turn-helix domain-containing protein [Limnochorda pilosa]BAS28725.1 molybdenum-pterin binding protein [Limnochorda pilosa]